MMKMEALTIGRLARAVGVNLETVRYYERRGLLPRPPRSGSGYRLFPNGSQAPPSVHSTRARTGILTWRDSRVAFASCRTHCKECGRAKTSASEDYGY